MGERWDEDDEDVMSFLEKIEAALRRMIVGVFRFIFVRLPMWVYELGKGFFDWIGRALGYMVRLTVKLARVLCLAVVWLALVFGPLTASLCWDWPLKRSATTPPGQSVPAKPPPASIPPGSITGVATWHVLGASWAVIGLIGSVWGVRSRWHTRRTPDLD